MPFKSEEVEAERGKLIKSLAPKFYALGMKFSSVPYCQYFYHKESGVSVEFRPVRGQGFGSMYYTGFRMRVDRSYRGRTFSCGVDKIDRVKAAIEANIAYDKAKAEGERREKTMVKKLTQDLRVVHPGAEVEVCAGRAEFTATVSAVSRRGSLKYRFGPDGDVASVKIVPKSTDLATVAKMVDTAW